MATSRLGHLSKQRSYDYDLRHIPLMLRDAFELVAIRPFSSRTRRHVIQLGRSIRGHAFEARDTMPIVPLRDLPSYLGGPAPETLVLPPVETIILAGLGGPAPYALLAQIVAIVRPRTIFETGTFRGVSALVFGLNCPDAQIYTLDLPPEAAEGDDATLTRGDKEWVRLVRGSTGIAFHDQPCASRIHQIFGDSLAFDVREHVTSAQFCFIDGGHSFECVKADTENALRILEPGGVIVWDDYTWFMDGVRSYLGHLASELELRRVESAQYVVYRKPA